MNENEQRLLEPQHKVSWRHPLSKHWHQLDMIIIGRGALKNVLHTRSYHSADCNTDQALHGMLQDQATTKEVPSHKETGVPSIDVSKMSQLHTLLIKSSGCKTEPQEY